MRGPTSCSFSSTLVGIDGRVRSGSCRPSLLDFLDHPAYGTLKRHLSYWTVASRSRASTSHVMG